MAIMTFIGSSDIWLRRPRNKFQSTDKVAELKG